MSLQHSYFSFSLQIDHSSLKDVKSISWGEGFAVTYSVTDRTSFNSALQIIAAIHEQKKTKDVVIALVGNKKDLEHFRSGECFWLCESHLV